MLSLIITIESLTQMGYDAVHQGQAPCYSNHRIIYMTTVSYRILSA
jgi:hypothetical protein